MGGNPHGSSMYEQVDDADPKIPTKTDPATEPVKPVVEDKTKSDKTGDPTGNSSF